MTQKRKARSLFAALLAVLLLLAALPLSAYATAAPAADVSLTVDLSDYNSFQAVVNSLSGSPDLATVTTLTITGSFKNGKAWDADDGAILAADFPNLDTLNMGSYSGTYSNNAFDPYSVGELSTLKMRRIRLPADVNLSSYMFYECPNLTTLVCGNGDWQDGVINLTGAGGYGEVAFGNCTAITQVRLPAGIAIPTGMFAHCASLKTLVCGDGTFEDGVIDLTGAASYGNEMFRRCTAITQVRLPDDIAISDGMFRGCTSLKGLTFAGNSPNAPSVGTNAFNGVSSNGTLTYPAGAMGYDTFAADAGLTGWRVLPIGYVDPVAPTPAPAAEGTPHVCDFGNWQYSNEHHWKRCSCMALSDYAPHVFNSARVCTVCGYGARPKKVNPPTGVHDSYMPRLA